MSKAESVLFRQISAEDASLLRTGLAGLLALDEAERREVLQAGEALLLASTEQRRREVSRQLYASLPGRDVDEALGVIEVLLDHLTDLIVERPELDPAEQLRAWFGDITGEGARLDQAKLELLHGEILAQLSGLASRRRRSTYARGVIPTVSNFGATVELRAVLTQEIDAIEATESMIEGLVPVASVSLSLGPRPRREIQFQVDEPGLKSLIQGLQNVQRALAQMSKLGEDIVDRGDRGD